MNNVILKYSFSATEKKITVNIPDFVANIECLNLIVNLTTNTIIYNVNREISQFSGGVQESVICQNNEIVFNSTNEGMNDNDKLRIEYDFFFDASLLELLSNKSASFLPEYINDVFYPTVKSVYEFVTGYLRQNKYQRKTNHLLNDIVLQNTSVETSIYTFSIDANTANAGNHCVATLYGSISKSNLSQVTIRLKLNGTTLQTMTTNTNALSAVPFELHLIGTLRSEGITGSFQMFQKLKIDNVSNDADVEGLINFNTQINNVFTITAQWNNATPSNIFRISQGYTQFV